MTFLFRSVQLLVLSAAFLLEAAVLYFPTDPSFRLVLGLLLILPIAWIVARSGMVQIIADLPAAVKKRRFTGLRRNVVLLLDEIRRLNWLAVDADRGFRNREGAMREMDAIEERLREIIHEIRRTAGQPAPERDLEARPMPGEEVTSSASDGGVAGPPTEEAEAAQPDAGSTDQGPTEGRTS